jgi:anti-anti-sigma regulatory factor
LKQFDKETTGLEFTLRLLTFIMFLAASNKARRLLHLSYIGRVSVEDLQQGSKELIALLTELPADLRVLVDLGRLESMDTGCAKILGKMMEVMEQHGMELIVRVIPDPTKDIGFNLISRFHYHRSPRTVTCKTMTEAGKLLAL